MSAEVVFRRGRGVAKKKRERNGLVQGRKKGGRGKKPLRDRIVAQEKKKLIPPFEEKKGRQITAKPRK